MHRRAKFDTVREKAQPEPVFYSKTDLLKMIIENDQKSGVLEKQSPLISVAEAIHGTYKTNFELNRKANPAKNNSLPLGQLNQGKDAQQALIARQQSQNSIQFIEEENRLKVLSQEEELRNCLSFLPENTLNRIMGPRRTSTDLKKLG